MKILEGNVELTHHKTSSIVEIIINSEEPTADGRIEIVPQQIMLDYYEVGHLRKILERFNH